MSGPSAIDLDRMRALVEMVGDDPAFVDELVDAYLEDAPRQLAAARAAIEAGTAHDLVRPAHTLKSNSANVGAAALGALCRGLEDQARAGTTEGAAARLGAVELEYARVVDALGALRATRWGTAEGAA